MKSCLYTFLLLIAVSFLHAQKKIPVSAKPKSGINYKKQVENLRQGNVRLMVLPTKDSIKLRWAVSDPLIWGYCNKYGFQIERYTVSRNGKLLPKIEKKVLTSQPLKPKPLKDWAEAATTNDYAAIMAQALYGETFSMNIKSGDSSSTSIARIYNKSAEVQQRYGAFYFAADFNFQAACIGAAGLIDTAVKQNEKYLYRVFTLIPSKLAKVDTALALCSTDEINTLPKLTEVIANFGDKTVSIGWNHEQANGKYTAYYIERKREDEDSFKRITSLPVSAFKSNRTTNKGGSSMIYYTDSISKNNIRYAYRIIGINPFAELGPFSDTLEGRGAEMLAFSPNISEIDFDSAANVIINWDFDKEGDKLIKGFELYYSIHIDSPSVKVMEIPNPTQRRLTYSIKDNAGYYCINALPFSGEARKSFPYLIQPEDSIPPLAPKGFKGWIDSSGLAILSWQPNKERDCIGYRLFRKYVASNEYSIVSDSIIRDTVYFDFNNNKLLNKIAYYELRAYDKRYNTSTGTEILLKKPDVIPPTAPLFSNFIVKADTVLLSWYNSRDDDIAKNILLRKRGFDNATNKWDTIYVTKKDTSLQTSYSDISIKASEAYTYAILSVDEDKNVSPITNTLKVTTLAHKPSVLFKISSIKADRDERKITIKWLLLPLPNMPKITEIQLYRSEGNQKMALYKILSANETSFVDKELTINSRYKYAIRAGVDGNMPSEFTLTEIMY